MIMPASEEAKKILEEAARIAEERLRAKNLKDKKA